MNVAVPKPLVDTSPNGDAVVVTPDAASLTPNASGEAASVTPMMRQYQEIKAAHPDCLLFYRMGDFYELFFQDAEIASRALGIVLTKRGKHNGADIPMCGVPVVRSDEYLHKLIAAGFRVAVCEQTEDPAEAKKRGTKSVVARDVIRLITAGTLTEDTLLDARRNNYLAAIVRTRASSPEAAALFALAYLDISTGEFRVTECDRLALAAEIARIEPGEIIVSDALYEDAELAPYLWTLPATPLTRDVFDGATADLVGGGAGGAASPFFFRGPTPEPLRPFPAAEPPRGGGVHPLWEPHAAGAPPAALAADPRGGGNDALDRCGNARQPRTDAH